MCVACGIIVRILYNIAGCTWHTPRRLPSIVYSTGVGPGSRDHRSALSLSACKQKNRAWLNLGLVGYLIDQARAWVAIPHQRSSQPLWVPEELNDKNYLTKGLADCKIDGTGAKGRDTMIISVASEWNQQPRLACELGVGSRF